MAERKWTWLALQEKLLNLPLVVKVSAYAEAHSLPGFQAVTIAQVTRFVLQEIKRDDLFTRANSIAFSFFLSLFPSLLALFTLIPFALRFLGGLLPSLSNFNQTLYGEIKRVMPGQAGDFVYGFIQEITGRPKIGLLSFGFVLALYFSSNGMLAMMRSFEKAYDHTFRRRTALKKRLVAVVLTSLLGLFLLASAILVVMGNGIIGWLTDLLRINQFSVLLIDASRWVIMLLLYYFTIGTMYRFGAATYRRFSYLSPGVTLAALLSLSTSVAFSLYVDGFNRYDTYSKFYGSIATVIIIMLWLQLNALILLIGFELNAAIAIHRDLRSLGSPAREENEQLSLFPSPKKEEVATQQTQHKAN
ncbi:MAG: YihY/virulence factor BrkB family protein [Lewinella sp.]|nr:YihY/virulence factor BrkB family protein [Lewinella sp.]